ncbi:hypothetical protein Unana1_05917 [Umbelopsis nana]
MTEAPRRSRSRSANNTPRMAAQQAPMPSTPPQMQGYPGGGGPPPPQQQQPHPNQQVPGMNHPSMQEGPAYPNTPYMQQQMYPQQGERGIFSGLRRKMREAAGFINTDPYNERAYGPQMMLPHQQPMQAGYANGTASPRSYGAAQQFAQQQHIPQQGPQMMQQQYMQHSQQYMGAAGNPYAQSMAYSQNPAMMQHQGYGGMAYPYGNASAGYYHRGSYGGAYSPYGNGYGSYGAYGAGAGAYGASYGAYGNAGAYGMNAYPYNYGYGAGAGGYMGYPRQMPIYDEHGKRIYPEHNYVSSVKDL